MVRRARPRPSNKARALQRQEATQRTAETRDAEASLEHARQLLKRYDLLELLILCSRLSLFEALTPADSPLSALPILNHENIRILSGLVLSSKAGFTGSRRLPSERELIAILNDCRQAGYDKENSKRLRDANGTERARLEVQRTLAKVFISQIPLQDNLSSGRAGRLIAMLERLPREFPERIPAGQRREVQQVLSVMEEILGATPSELFQILKGLLVWLEDLVYQPIMNSVSAAASVQSAAAITDERSRRQFKIVCSFLTPQEELDSLIAINLQDFISAFQRAVPESASTIAGSTRAFFALASRSVQELRDVFQQEDFKKGTADIRLSPLNRFPIVRIDDPEASGPRFVVPNVRILNRAFDYLIDFALRDRIGSTYDHARGALLHLYLRQLIETQLPGLVVIPETSYDSSTGRRESADLTLIDFIAHRIIGIEIKGRSINLSTRVMLETELITRNLEDVFSALSRLPRKIADLRSNESGFAQWKDEIETSREFPSILVGVLREGLPLALPELLREHANLDTTHPLNSIEETHCILSADVFERAVELARLSGRPLGELLDNHYRQSSARDFASHNADAFGEDHRPLPDTFALTFLPRKSDI